MGLIASACFAAVTLLLAVTPPFSLPGRGAGEGPLFPAPPGYLLPWAGGEIQSVTQGEDTSLTHNGQAAYAFDFGLNYDTVVAARSGRVAMVYDGSNRGGCDPALSSASNYIVIDHGDGTSALYLHLAYDSTLATPGDLVERGQPLALSGDTGVTCSDNDDGPAPHLHFQVQSTEDDRYSTQSLPVAFDDVSEKGGVPTEGTSYVSGNYGRGKPQKIKLTAHRAERIFAPKATPAAPGLTEIQPEPTATATLTPAATATATPTVTRAPNTATPSPSAAPVPSSTPTPDTPTPDTPTPAVSDTPVTVQTETPSPTVVAATPATPEPAVGP